MKSQGRGNLQVIFIFHAFRKRRGRRGLCAGTLMKSRTFWGVHFPFFAKFVLSAVIMIHGMPAAFGFYSPKETFVSRLINLDLNV